jgi:hypothetical protein
VEDKRKKTMTLTTKIISAEVEFDRYITLKEGTHSLAYYELVSFNVFKGKGTTVNEGHYESYVLSPDKKWYNKNDDNKITESESAFDVINNHKDKAYIYFIIVVFLLHLQGKLLTCLQTVMVMMVDVPLHLIYL